MSERIVVSCRMNGEEVSRPSSRYLDRARSLTQHAEALGATLAAWSATTLAFSFDVDSLEEALELVSEASSGNVRVWACGVARGDMEPLADASKGGGGRADLAWGEALVAAVILARAARAGEVLVEATLEGLDDLVQTGKRLAHDGERTVSGVRVDPRQPWKRDMLAGVERLRTPAFVGRPDPHALLVRPGLVHVLRADPGHGGTRMLAEIARAVAPGPCLVVAPTGASVEPLGALRRALVRALATRPYPDDPELAPALDMFLGGIGASIDQAAAIVSSLLRPMAPADPPGALLIDDAGEIDAESLEACTQVVAWMSIPFHVFVRIDATDVVPPALAQLPMGLEIELGPLDRDGAEGLAREMTGGALGARAARRFARRAGYGPLGVVEAVAYGLTVGELAWIGDRAGLRTPGSFAGKPAAPSHWISRRAKATAPDERGVLATVALFGGEALLAAVKEALKLVEAEIDVDAETKKLIARRWLVETQPGWVALPSRTHRDTIADLLDETPRRVLHHAIADVLEQSEGELGCAEAAHHAVKAGDGERGARLALRAARAAAVAGMSKSANRLLTLARLADPKCEPLTRQQLLTSLPPPIAPPSAPPSRRPAPPAPPTSRLIDGAFAHGAARSPPEDVPTERVSVMNVAHAANVLASRPAFDDLDEPTLSRAPGDADRLRAEAEELHERTTQIDPLPRFVAPPPSIERSDRAVIVAAPAAPMPRQPPLREAPAVRPAAGETNHLPRPMAPPPLRSSRQMPAAVPRDVPSARQPAAPAPVSRPHHPPPPRVSVQGMPAVRVAPAAAPRPASDDEDRTLAGVAPPAQPPPPMQPPLPSPGLPSPLPPPLSASSSSPPPPPVASAETARAVATRMIDLAKNALIEGDAAAIERWTEGLRAAGEHDRLAERIEAIARLGRGQVGEALRTLRAQRDVASSFPAASRAQASLALGVALAAANRADEALLSTLEALARAREVADARAAEACLAFLAKLYSRLERPDDAGALLAAAKRLRDDARA